eukprot:g18795.t1
MPGRPTVNELKEQTRELRSRRNHLQRQLRGIKENLETLEREKRDLQREARQGGGQVQLPAGVNMQQAMEMLAAMASLSGPAMPALENGEGGGASAAAVGGDASAAAGPGASAAAAVVHPELGEIFAAGGEEDDLLADQEMDDSQGEK